MFESNHKARRYNRYAYRRMLKYLRYLQALSDSEPKQHDIDYMRRLMSQFLNVDDVVNFNIDARIRALKTKFENVVKFDE